MNCRSSSAVQDGGQPTLLTSRVDALQDTVQDLDRQMDSVNVKTDTFETTMAAIHNQLKALKESSDKMTSQVTRLELSMNSQFTEMKAHITEMGLRINSRIDSRFAKMESSINKMDLGMNSRFQDMNSRVAELSSDMIMNYELWVQRDDAEE
ncbi:hypothetical protein E4U39_006524 [Claviceps sp. Clav50 group G5]|nr:hypothetical protein E4U39_006524 [Claviceps sp. Clav50 group G5]